MDSAFVVDEAARSSFLRYLMHCFGCTYICLWLYLPQPSSCLSFLDGLFLEESNSQQRQQQPSSSSGSLPQRLFHQYGKLVFNVADNQKFVPGLAINGSIPYLELKELNLLRHASTETQLQFYQEARIKTAVFIGCKHGEIELGMSNVPQVNIEMELKGWFPEHFSRKPELLKELPQLTIDQNPPSSSSSLLRSLDSPDQCSPLPSNINPPSTYISSETTSIEQVPLPISTVAATTATAITNRVDEVCKYKMQDFRQMGNIQFPREESEATAAAVMTREMFAVMPFSSSSSPLQPPPYSYHHLLLQKSSAFKKYASMPRTGMSKASSSSSGGGRRRRSMVERAVAYFRNLHSIQIRTNQQSQPQPQSNHPSSSQLHHMIAERKRREKLNDSFQALKALLPSGCKRDKASVLASTRAYLSSLKAQVAELGQRNERLEAELSNCNEESSSVVCNVSESDSCNDMIDIRIDNVVEATQEERSFSLRIRVRGEFPLLDLSTRTLEFLRRVNTITLISMEAESQSNPWTQILFLRLRAQGDEWEEPAFRDAVRRIFADLAR